MTLFLPRKPPNFGGIKLGTRKEGDGRSSREKGSIVQRREELGASDVDCLRCYYIFHIKKTHPLFPFLPILSRSFLHDSFPQSAAAAAPCQDQPLPKKNGVPLVGCPRKKRRLPLPPPFERGGQKKRRQIRRLKKKMHLLMAAISEVLSRARVAYHGAIYWM